MKIIKFLKGPNFSLAFNFVYAVLNCVIGFATLSWWFVTLGAYYAVLAVSRFSVLQVGRKSGGDIGLENFAKKIILMMLLYMTF